MIYVELIDWGILILLRLMRVLYYKGWLTWIMSYLFRYKGKEENHDHPFSDRLPCKR
jgi:hypothetical protein